MTETDLTTDEHYRQAIGAVERTIARLKDCDEAEREHLRQDVGQLNVLLEKLHSGRVEIVIFGEISTGKSALINALVGKAVASVDVRGGWTKEVWHVPWEGSGYCVPGVASSQVVLIDTPGLNEVGGQDRAVMAADVARRSDLILFVTDSDLNDVEHAAVRALAAVNKPMIVVLNKRDLYTPSQRERLVSVLRDERLGGLVPAENLVLASADPREIEYLIEGTDGSSRSEWRKPAPDVTDLKIRILEVLESEGLALIALNAALYAADTTDRVAALRVQMRDRQATQAIFGLATAKALTVALSIIPIVDILAGSALDATLVATLSRIYGLEMTWAHAKELATSILKAAGWLLIAELATNWTSSTLKGLLFGYAPLITALPQGAAAGYTSYVVGQAAKYYFEHGSSWGPDGPKAVVQRILEQTDKATILAKLKSEISARLRRNPHAGQSQKGSSQSGQ